MSHLAAAIEQLLADKKMKPVELSKRSGISQPQISRWRSGEQVWIDPKDLEQLAAAFGKERNILALLLRGHLLDECHGNENLVTVEVANPYAPHVLRDAPAEYKVKLPPKMDHAMQVIASRLTSEKELQKIILSLGNLYEKGTLE